MHSQQFITQFREPTEKHLYYFSFFQRQS